MIIGIGQDIVNIKRVEKLLKQGGQRFLNRCFTEAEQAIVAKRKGKAYVAALARRVAAKEACSKALGTGIGKDAKWTEMEITPCQRGKPVLALHGAALKHAKTMLPKGKKLSLHLSMSDDEPWAAAVVVIEAV